MQSYNGLIKCDPPLSKEEVVFLNSWQNQLKEIFTLYKTEGKDSYLKMDSFLNLDLNDGQRWTICQWSYCPMIKWSEKGMEVSGEHEKGQFRSAVLCYLHLLIGSNPVIRDAKYKDLSFLKEHKLNGIIESEKDNVKWLYFIENNNFYSVDVDSLEEYEINPHLYEKTVKSDNCQDKLDKYFPTLYLYAKINKTAYSKTLPTKNTNRIKI